MRLREKTGEEERKKEGRDRQELNERDKTYDFDALTAVIGRKPLTKT
jgi:hypothetical protein